MTDSDNIQCEHIVSATGSFARRTGAMVGLDIPVISVEHQYIVTEPHPAILERQRRGLPEMGVLRESDSSWYLREEAGGFILGPYEASGAPCCYLDGPEAQSEYELFQEDLERLAPHIDAAIARVPAFGEVGVKKVYNGAIAYTPDGSPIIGPAWDLPNFWLNEGHSFGVTATGGAGWQLAHWIIEGEPSVDMMGVDPRRFGPYATRGYLRAKNEEAYANVFTVHYPDEERASARPLRRSSGYDPMKALGAVFGSTFGWELRIGSRPKATRYPTPISRSLTCCSITIIRRSRRVRGHARGGVCGGPTLSISSDANAAIARDRRPARYVGLREVRGVRAGVEAWLDGLVANRLPKRIGGIALCHMLSKNGGVRSEFTVYREGPEKFYLVGAGALERHDWDYLWNSLPKDGSVYLQKVTTHVVLRGAIGIAH